MCLGADARASDVGRPLGDSFPRESQSASVVELIEFLDKLERELAERLGGFGRVACVNPSCRILRPNSHGQDGIPIEFGELVLHAERVNAAGGHAQCLFEFLNRAAAQVECGKTLRCSERVRRRLNLRGGIACGAIVTAANLHSLDCHCWRWRLRCLRTRNFLRRLFVFLHAAALPRWMILPIFEEGLICQ
jgi:hypothetical protein